MVALAFFKPYGYCRTHLYFVMIRRTFDIIEALRNCARLHGIFHKRFREVIQWKHLKGYYIDDYWYGGGMEFCWGC